MKNLSILLIFLCFGMRSQTHPPKDSVKTVNDPEFGEVYAVVEEMPFPKGGVKDFMYYLSQNIKFPKEAKEKGISGKAFLRFIVNSEGVLEGVRVLKGVPDCKECDEEALRVIKAYPNKWTPGKQNGIPVPVYYNVPINFEMKETKKSK
jgi:periplasmic protein TonB